MFTEEQAERLVMAFEKIADALTLSRSELHGHPEVGSGIAKTVMYLADSIHEANPDTATLSAELANIADQIDGIPQGLEAIAANIS